MTYVIAEPCIDVKDKACIRGARPSASAKASGCSASTPASAPAGAPASRPARPGRSSAKTMCPASGPSSPSRTQTLRSARLARRRRQDRPAALRHRVCRQLRRGAVARGALAQQWRGGRANADPAADPVPLGNPVRSADLRVPGGQAAWVYSLITPHYNTARPHQSITQHVPDGHRDTARRATVTDLDTARIHRRPVLGGVLPRTRSTSDWPLTARAVRAVVPGWPAQPQPG